jgi:hypothetical protein
MNLNKRKNILSVNIGIKSFKKTQYILFENNLNKNKRINKKQLLFLDFFKYLDKKTIKYYLYGKKFNSFYNLNTYKALNLIVLTKLRHIIFNGIIKTNLELFSWKNCFIKYYFLNLKALFFFNCVTKIKKIKV